MKTRAEHLEWCKQRAMEFCERGDADGGLLSMLRDLGKHTETAASTLLIIQLRASRLSSMAEVLKFIDDCK